MQENLLEKQFLNHPLYAKIQELKALNLACNFSLDDSVNYLQILKPKMKS